MKLPAKIIRNWIVLIGSIVGVCFLFTDRFKAIHAGLPATFFQVRFR